MKVFVSWSGDRSKQFASHFTWFVKRIIQNAVPFHSEESIRAGKKWVIEIGNNLESTNVGVLCLTRENYSAPWIHFEAGALSKLQTSSVMPYMLDDDDKNSLPGPLTMFQAKKHKEKAEVREILYSINQAAKPSLDEEVFNDTFCLWWPQYVEKINSIPKTQAPKPEGPSDSELLSKIVALLESQNSQAVTSKEIPITTSRSSKLRNYRDFAKQLIEDDLGLFGTPHDHKTLYRLWADLDQLDQSRLARDGLDFTAIKNRLWPELPG